MPRAKRGEKAAPTEEPALGISADELTAICEVRHATSLCRMYTHTQSSRPTPAWTRALGAGRRSATARVPGVVKRQVLLQPQQTGLQTALAIAFPLSRVQQGSSGYRLSHTAVLQPAKAATYRPQVWDACGCAAT